MRYQIIHFDITPDRPWLVIDTTKAWNRGMGRFATKAEAEARVEDLRMYDGVASSAETMRRLSEEGWR